MMRSVGGQGRPSLHTRTWLAVSAALLLFTLSALAQQAAKRPLAHSDYDTWRAIQLQQLSRDGKVLAYALNPQDADGEVVARLLTTGVEWRHPRGHRPDAPPAVQSDDDEVDQGRGGGRGGAAGGAGAAAAGLALTSDAASSPSRSSRPKPRATRRERRTGAPPTCRRTPWGSWT